MRNLKTAIIFVLLALLMQTSCTQTKEEPQSQDEKMEWWRDARFGMFVHWGLYSIAAGEWDGVVNDGYGQEWIQYHKGIPTAEYERVLRPQFQPKADFASEWAKLAKEAGCKYVVLTSKHHDGFALHDSKVSEYDAMDFVGRDLIKEFVDACKKEGLKVGLYHSVIDWHHPDAYTGGGLPSIKDETNEERNHDRYVDYLHTQVDELISYYGDVDIIWWDYSSEELQGEKWKADELIAKVKEKHPSIIMNNRLFANIQTGGTSAEGFDLAQGDYITPEQKIPATGIDGVDWETCMTMNNTWGYSKHDHDWKSTEALIRNLIDAASKGGNYLLNIGPEPDGTIPAESVERMREIGDWMKVNGESIYATKASPFEETSWGRCTQKELGDNKTRLYLHVFDFPEDGVININSDMKVHNAVYLDGNEKIDLVQDNDRVILTLDKDKANKYATVLVLDVEL